MKDGTQDHPLEIVARLRQVRELAPIRLVCRLGPNGTAVSGVRILYSERHAIHVPAVQGDAGRVDVEQLERGAVAVDAVRRPYALVFGDLAGVLVDHVVRGFVRRPAAGPVNHD
jgi:hypothetical protein